MKAAKLRKRAEWPASGPGARSGALATMPVEVATVRANVTAPDMELVTADFSAATGTGTIDNIPVGSNRTVALQGLNSSQIVIFQGESTPVTVTAGQVADAGTVVMEPPPGAAGPSDVFNFQAVGGNGEVVLSWTNPGLDFAGVRIVRRSGAGFPVSPLDGTLVYEGGGSGGNAPYTFSWDFGGGATNSTLQNPAATYATAGTYVTALTVTDADGDTDTAFRVITVVTNLFPSVTLDSPTTGITISEGETLSFAATGTGGNAPVTFDWDFGGAATNSGVEDPGSVILAGLGTFTVTVTVSDIDGSTDSASISVIVVPRPTPPVQVRVLVTQPQQPTPPTSGPRVLITQPQQPTQPTSVRVTVP